MAGNNPITISIEEDSLYANSQLLGVFNIAGGDNISLDNGGIINVVQDPSFSSLTINGDVSGNIANFNTITSDDYMMTGTQSTDVNSLTRKDYVDSQVATKQDLLTEGSGITISGNTISSNAVTYTAGSNININAQDEIETVLNPDFDQVDAGNTSIGGGGSAAVFHHKNLTEGFADWAITHYSNGKLILNSKTSQEILFRQNQNTKARVATNGDFEILRQGTLSSIQIELDGIQGDLVTKQVNLTAYHASLLAVKTEIAGVKSTAVTNLADAKLYADTKVSEKFELEKGLRETANAELTVRIAAAEQVTNGHIAEATAASAAEVAARITGDAELQALHDAHVGAYDARVLSVNSSLNAIAKANRDMYVIEGEGNEPVFSCGTIPFASDFGIPIMNASELEKISFICLTPDKSINGSHIMTLQLEVYSPSNQRILTTPISFTGRKHLHIPTTPYALPAGSNVVIRYASKTGLYHPDSRFRMTLQTHSTELDSLL